MSYTSDLNTYYLILLTSFFTVVPIKMKNKMRKSILTLFALMAFIHACHHPSNKGRVEKAKNEMEEYQWISAKVDSAMKANNIPALSIGIINNGKVVYRKGFGYQTRDQDIKVDENTLYQIGSDTKKFTAIVVKNLAAEGKVNLDEPITNYLKGKLTSSAEKKFQGITLRTLLLHKAGIPYRAPGNPRIDGDPMLIPYSEEQLIDDLNKLKLEFKPGTAFAYSNLGYAIIGYICEEVSGKEYSELVKTYVTEKYGMNNTVVNPTKDQLARIAIPYRKDDRNIKSAPWKMGKLTPAGGIYANVVDISHLMLAQLKAYQAFTKTGDGSNPLILTEHAGTETSYYGFGLGKKVDENGTRYGHGGDLDGFASDYVFSPDYEMGVIILTSSGGPWIGQLSIEIRKAMIAKIHQ